MVLMHRVVLHCNDFGISVSNPPNEGHPPGEEGHHVAFVSMCDSISLFCLVTGDGKHLSVLFLCLKIDRAF